MHNNIQRYGNTTAATIPTCVHEAIELGKIKPGHPRSPPGGSLMTGDPGGKILTLPGGDTRQAPI
jgi:hypothetical protein